MFSRFSVAFLEVVRYPGESERLASGPWDVMKIDKCILDKLYGLRERGPLH